MKNLAYTRLVDPTQDTSLPKEAWDEMINDLNKHRNTKDAEFFCKMIFYMRILATHKVEITEKGIEFTDAPPPKLDVITPPRPIRKKK